MPVYNEGKISFVRWEGKRGYPITLIFDLYLRGEVKDYVVGQKSTLSAAYILADFTKTCRLSDAL